ncbi:glycosyl-transferase for dystroglycan-domain-containing protein [Mucor mucedo]|uniref:glycosyl-transferase for dystroglycan-domain-containing protein n=1 Tax=Mucor mucedo TaxID=29922 RepID=UPI0022203001|nr:glycosyl-transferase for dystroglycan-domain-containing protein [Mucor mucedo]KAI7889939.1 glycosyl-transferase for dystroglycan-domain-containing protein [Mucor mucedo]
MDKLLGRKATSQNSNLDNDKNKPFYNNSRRHYKRFSSSPPTNAWQRRLLSPAKGIIPLIAIVFLFFMLFPSGGSSKKSNRIQLREQPTYEKHASSCSVELCNPLNKCSTWLPNQRYNWSDLSKAGVFRDLSTINVSTGCDLRIKVEGRVDGGEWLTIPNGLTECTETGYGTKCRNFVELDLKADILIMATQMKNLMKDKSSQSQEIILVQHAGEILDTMDVTLISQFSVNRLETFAKAIKSWSGPITAAIYLTNAADIEELVEFFSVQKNLEAYAGVTLALVKPNYLSNAHLAYPINHLRNIAITESSTEYIFVLDADFSPSINLYGYLRNKLLPFIAYQSGKIPDTAWVVPCFALREGYDQIPLPDSYDELRKLVGRDIAYITDPGAGHGPTLATEIAMVRPLLLGNPLAYEVCFESQWEPYYILHRSAPLYDARFKNQGGDKQAHALHLNAEKFRFMILREVFMMHKDHSKMIWPDGGFEKAQKAIKKWNYFDEFMHEIESLYGTNVRWPKGCTAMAIGWQDQRRDGLGLAAGAA